MINDQIANVNNISSIHAWMSELTDDSFFSADI